MTALEKANLTVRIAQLHLHATEFERRDMNIAAHKRRLSKIASEMTNIIYDATRQLCGVHVSLDGDEGEVVSGMITRNCKYSISGTYWYVELCAPVVKGPGTLYTVVFITITPDVEADTVRVEVNGKPVEFFGGDPSHVLEAAVGILEGVLTKLDGQTAT